MHYCTVRCTISGLILKSQNNVTSINKRLLFQIASVRLMSIIANVHQPICESHIDPKID